MSKYSVAAQICALASGLVLTAPALAEPVTAVLRLTEKVPMATLAHDVTDPTSPRFQKFYTPAEIRALAGPSDSDYQALLSSLAARGLTVVSESPTHLFVSVRGEKALFETHFKVQVESLVSGLHKLHGDVTLPAGLDLVASVSGLDSTRKSHSHVRRLDGGDNNNNNFQGVSLDEIRTLYGFQAIYAQGLTGKGQDIAIASYDDINLDDVNEYYAKQNLSPAPTVDKVTFNGKPATNLESAVETETDTEFSGALAPGAAIHVYTSVTNDDAGEEAMFTRILDDNKSKVVNYSWGDCEFHMVKAHLTAMDALFNRAVAQGVNIAVATGDTGSGCPDADTVNADWPAGHPSVVAVGGSTVDYNNDSLAEKAWNGSGGGISTLWDLPSYQSSFKAPYTKRSYPDLAFNADPNSGQASWVNDQGHGAEYLVIGGTSIAAPQVAGFLALVGEARAKAGQAPVGFINPIIYGLNDSDRSSSFDDVLSGSNGAYKAGRGWDAVTGWGGLKADGLFSVLTR